MTFHLILASNDIDISKLCVIGLSIMYIEILNHGLKKIDYEKYKIL